jgi:hypothetical protein
MIFFFLFVFTLLIKSFPPDDDKLTRGDQDVSDASRAQVSHFFHLLYFTDIYPATTTGLETRLEPW